MSARFSFAVFDRPLAAAFRFGEQSLDHRRGIILRRELDGTTSFAEASPLPGHSQESLSDALSALASLSAPTRAGAFPPSLRFALDSFSLSACGFTGPVRSNALLPSGEGRELKYGEAFSAGYRAFKLKAFPENMAEVLGFVRNHRQDGVKFRIDGNRSLSQRDLTTFFDRVVQDGLAQAIDYVEEPVLQPWSELPSDAPVALAADESASSAEEIIRLLELRAPSVFILKPTVIGSLSVVEELRDEIVGRGKRAVVTSTLETEIGRRALIHFLGNRPDNEIHGVSTGFLFSENFFSDAPSYAHLPLQNQAELDWLHSLTWELCK